MRSIAIIGSTGSIGTQTLDVVRANADIRVAALAAGDNIELLEKQVREFRPELVSVKSEDKAKALAAALSDFNCKITYGMDGLIETATCEKAELVVTAIVGMIGIRPTIEAIKAGKDIALANKESIVCGHVVVDRALAEFGGKILPVDSEQSAIFQCLAAGRSEDVRSLILTASGGMFRNASADELARVTPQMALRHPTWSMGGKITIDSSTLFNKGLELMEAGWLFDIEPNRIEILIHPQSVVHSMVEFCDGAVFAQMSPPDMRLAIQYALTYPHRITSQLPRLDLAALHSLTFEKPDCTRFPAISLAYDAFRDGSSLPIAYNSANETAVELFVRGCIGFTDIAKCVEYSMERIPREKIGSVDDILYLDKEARRLACECFGKETL